MKRGMLAVAVGAFGLAVAASGSAAARPSHARARAAAIRLVRNSPPAQGKHRVGKHQLYTTNWSGYGVTDTATFTDTFSDVTGTWTQPAATCPYKGHKESNAAIFAGLDGINSGTVEQTGVDTICIGSTPEYIPWYEFYPARTVVAPSTDTVDEGDMLSAEVSVSGGQVTTTLRDTTKGWTFTSPAMSASGLALNSAEWIVEKNIHLMTDFGRVDWTSASATAGSTTAGINDGPWDPIDIYAFSKGGRTPTECAGPDQGLTSSTSFTDYFDGCS